MNCSPCPSFISNSQVNDDLLFGIILDLFFSVIIYFIILLLSDGFILSYFGLVGTQFWFDLTHYLVRDFLIK